MALAQKPSYQIADTFPSCRFIVQFRKFCRITILPVSSRRMMVARGGPGRQGHSHGIQSLHHRLWGPDGRPRKRTACHADFARVRAFPQRVLSPPVPFIKPILQGDLFLFVLEQYKPPFPVGGTTTFRLPPSERLPLPPSVLEGAHHFSPPFQGESPPSRQPRTSAVDFKFAVVASSCGRQNKRVLQ